MAFFLGFFIGLALVYGTAMYSRQKRSFSQYSRGRYDGPKKRTRAIISSPAFQRIVKRYSKPTGYVDLAVATYAMNTTGSITMIATVPQGTSVNSRVGKRIRWNSIQIRGYVSSDSTTVQCNGALLLVYDKRPTGSLPAITDILVSVNQNSFNNDDNSGRFKIIRRWDWAFIGNNTTAGQQTDSTVRALNEYVKLKDMCVYKTGTTGVIAQIEQGALYAITVGNVAAGTGDANAGIGYRVRFTDVLG